MGAGTGRVHVFRATRAARRRRSRALPHRDAADLPPHGLLRDLHVPPGAQRLLLERLASASVGGRCTRPARIASRRSTRTSICRRSGRGVPRRAPRACRAGDRVRDADCERLPAVQAELARAGPRGWGYDHRGAMIRVLGGVGDPATRTGESRRRAGRESLFLHGVSDRRRPRRHRARDATRDRRTTSRIRPTARRCRAA